MRVKAAAARFAVAVSALAAVGVTGLVSAPAASAATATTTVLAVDVAVCKGSACINGIRIDDGSSVTCLVAGDQDWAIRNWRGLVTTDYEVTPGTSYGVSAWGRPDCTGGSLGGVTVTPTDADLSSGVYWVTIP